MARKLVTIAYSMLKNNEPYRYARPERMQEKFTKLKVLKQNRLPKRKAQSPRPGLSTVYHAVGLPAVKEPQQLPVGERRMLADQKLEQFVEELYQPPGSPTRKTASPKSLRRPAARRGGRAKAFFYLFRALLRRASAIASVRRRLRRRDFRRHGSGVRRRPGKKQPPSGCSGARAPRRTVDPAIPRRVASPQSPTPLHRTPSLYSGDQKQRQPC